MTLHAVVELFSREGVLGHEWYFTDYDEYKVHTSRRIPSSVEVICYSLASILAWHPVRLSCRATTHGQRRIWLLLCVPAAVASSSIQADPIMLLQF